MMTLGILLTVSLPAQAGVGDDYSGVIGHMLATGGRCGQAASVVESSSGGRWSCDLIGPQNTLRAFGPCMAVLVDRCVESGDADGDGYEGDVDCDDDDATVYPGAPELCDGSQNDCDASWSGDVGLVSFEGAAGWEDHTDAWSAGATGAPAALTYDAPGALHICPGTWYVNLTVEADLEVLGSGAEITTLDGGGWTAPGSIVDVETDGVSLTVADLTLSNGWGTTSDLPAYDCGKDTAGGALRCVADAAITGRNLTLSGNVTEFGAGLYLDGCAASLEAVTLRSNYGCYGGGVAAIDGDVSAIDATLDANYASEYGAALYLSGSTLSLTDSAVTENDAVGSGGAVIMRSSDALIDNVTFDGNSSDGTVGGAIYQYSGSLTITDSAFTGNYTELYYDSYGGAIYSSSGAVSITGSTFSGNQANRYGGAIFANGAELTVTDSTFEQNSVIAEYTSGYGGAIALEESSALIDGAVFTDNEDNAIAARTDFSLELVDCGFSGHSDYDVGVGSSSWHSNEYTWASTVSAVCDESGCVE